MSQEANYNDWMVKPFFFSKNELKFFYELQKYIKWKRVLLFSKVRVADLVKNRKYIPTSEFYQVFWRTSQRHIDYVITDYKWRLLCAIELDWDSHKTDIKTIASDDFKKKFFKTIELPLIRFQNNKEHNLKRLDKVLS